VLLGGNHAEILRWRRARALEKTRRNRPDLLDGAALNEKG
jgi:tRNA (guanine37-N1)-methyltransferase